MLIPSIVTSIFCAVASYGALSVPATQELRVDHSVVDYLKSVGKASDQVTRSQHWNERFPKEKGAYTGTAIQNMRLLEALRIKKRPLPESCKIPGDLSKPIQGLQTHSIDRRPEKNRDASGSYFVIFSARPAGAKTPGHAWVSFALSEGAKPEACVARTFGAFPNEGEKGWSLGGVPGGLVEGWAKNLDKYNEASRLIVQVDSATYVAARTVLELWSKRKEYKLLEKDCTSFAREVAKATRLKTNEERFPNPFIEKLIEDNRARQRKK